MANPNLKSQTKGGFGKRVTVVLKNLWVGRQQFPEQGGKGVKKPEAKGKVSGSFETF